MGRSDLARPAPGLHRRPAKQDRHLQLEVDTMAGIRYKVIEIFTSEQARWKGDIRSTTQ